MEVGRRCTARNGGVVSGSVWESRMKSDEVKGGIKVFNGEETTSEENNVDKKPRPKQSLVGVIDLVMWRDASKSAFVFGLGTFIIISSSYTKDLNISLISVVSYLGLVYLAAIFFFRSIICSPFFWRSSDHNELAVLLFVLARCGNSITIWKMAKLGFFGVFTVPKICSSYSAQLTACGTFWIRRFRDAWESCSHKKAVAFGIFTLGWNLSSVVARIWAVFMLFVAFRYYHQSVMREDDLVVEEEESKCETSWQGQIGGHRRRRVPITTVDIKKDKKRF
ncbi:hypothetical protein CsSME_00008068 [Camellia sinensis var. sinensis]